MYFKNIFYVKMMHATEKFDSFYKLPTILKDIKENNQQNEHIK